MLFCPICDTMLQLSNENTRNQYCVSFDVSVAVNPRKTTSK